jgi:transcription antitermination factor NusG
MKSSKLNWHIIVTLPEREQKVAQLLARKKIKAFCPLNLLQSDDDDETQTIQKQEPLFHAFVFVQIDEKNQKLVKSINGVVDFVYWLDKPAIVREDEINFLQTYGSGCFFLQKRKMAINENASMEVTRGANSHLNQSLNSINAYLPSMGYQIFTEISNVNFGVIKKNLESQGFILDQPHSSRNMFLLQE